MEEDESWKGEGLIRKKPKDGRKEATRLANVIYHNNRRKAGAPPAGRKKHDALMRSLHSEKDP